MSYFSKCWYLWRYGQKTILQITIFVKFVFFSVYNTIDAKTLRQNTLTTIMLKNVKISSKNVHLAIPEICQAWDLSSNPCMDTKRFYQSNLKQVRTNIGLADSLIPSSFIYFTYMGGTGLCDTYKIIFGNHVHS